MRLGHGHCSAVLCEVCRDHPVDRLIPNLLPKIWQSSDCLPRPGCQSCQAVLHRPPSPSRLPLPGVCVCVEGRQGEAVVQMSRTEGISSACPTFHLCPRTRLRSLRKMETAECLSCQNRNGTCLGIAWGCFSPQGFRNSTSPSTCVTLPLPPRCPQPLLTKLPPKLYHTSKNSSQRRFFSLYSP